MLFRRGSIGALPALAILAAVVLVMMSSGASADELRGWWIDAWHSGFLNQAQVDKLLGVPGSSTSTGDMRDANLNAVFVQVRRRADTCYPSGMSEPYFTSGNFNALQAIINAAHDTTGGKKRIEVHCWIVTFATGGGTVYSRHNNPSDPDNYWMTLDAAGAETDDQAFDPGHPKCEDYTVNVVMDLVNNFDIDGIHYDYIRFTGSDQGYNPTSVARYNARYGLSGKPSATNAQWEQWRRDQVTSVVRKSYAKIQAVKPALKQSGAFVTWTASPTSSTRSAFLSTPPYDQVYSDWDSWMQEGIMDMGVPMTYFDQAANASDWTKWTNFEKDRKGNRQMVIGPGLYLNTQPNAISQLLSTRTASPSGNYANGFCGYDYYTPYDGGSWSSSWASTLKTQVTPSAVNIPVMSWKTSPTKGHISGTVTIAATGTWADGASVSITGPASKSQTCDGTGFYAFIDLAPGTYTVTASKSGYPDIQKTVVVAIGSVTGNMYVTDFGLGASAPPVINNVQAGSLTNTGATITWTTDQTSSSQVEYGLTASYGSSTSLNSNAVMSHSVALTGLTANTLYHYRVKSGNTNGTTTSGDYTFTSNGPPSISNVQAGTVGANTATITWSTTTPSDSKVNYGLTTSYGSQATNVASTTSHAVVLSGLSPNTLYHYQCVSANAYGSATTGDYSFTTNPLVTEIVVDNTDAGWSNTSPNGNPWSTGGTAGVAKIGTNYLYASAEMSTTETGSTRRCRWTPDLPASGYYDVYVFYQCGTNRTSAAPYVIHKYGGEIASTQNQYGSASGSGYYLAGQNVPFLAGTDGYVELSTLGTGSGVVVDADAAKWVYKSALDLTPPSISVSAPSATATRNGPVIYTITYGDADSVGLASGNIALNTTGTANGTISVTGSGTASRTVTISSITGDGTLGISVAAGTASDVGGNLAPAAGPSATFSVDNTIPTISVSAPSATATRGGPVTYTVSYTGADSVTLAGGNITLNRTGSSNGALAVTGSGTASRTVTISSITGEGTLGISIAAGTASDNAGNTAPFAGASATFVVDNTAPTISVGGRSASLTRGGPVSYTVSYGGADSVTLSSANITLNTTGTANGTATVTGTGTDSRTVSISSVTGDGTIGISIAANSASDSAGNFAPAVGPSSTFTVDNTAPTIAIDPPSGSLTRGGPITYAITYSGADTVTLANANVTLNKTGTANGTLVISGTGTTSRTVTISSITGNGTLGISVASGTASDNAGNLAPVAGPSATFTVDNTAPTVSISSPTGAPTRSGPITYTITYTGADVVTLANGDVTLNKTGTANGTVNTSGTGTATRTVTISSVTGDGTLSISLASGTASDNAGNMAAATGGSSSASVDNTAPTVSISAPSASQTTAGPVTYSVTYGGASSVTLSTGNITLNKTGTANGTLSVTGTGSTTRTVSISSISGDGTLGISIAAGSATDAAGNLATAAGPSTTFAVSNTAPTMTNVTDEIYTTSTTSLQASWNASSARTIARYEYAVGSTSGGTDIKGWTDTGVATSATISGLSLTIGHVYYISARTTDDASLTSAPMSSAGVKIARAVAGIQQAKSLANGEAIGLPPLVVSAKFAGILYIEDVEQLSGIRVESDAPVSVGQNVTVFGIMGVTDGHERTILSPKVVTEE